VLIVLSLTKPLAAAGRLSCIGDDPLVARGSGLVLWLRRRGTFPHERTAIEAPCPAVSYGRGA
jgi:hypothetical protein